GARAEPDWKSGTGGTRVRPVPDFQSGSARIRATRQFTSKARKGDIGMALDGKVIVVTGAGRVLGKAYAEGLAARGARVAVADIDLPAAREVAAAIGEAAVAFPVDVADEASARGLAAAVAERFGGIDVLLNNAGLNPAPDTLSLVEV